MPGAGGKVNNEYYIRDTFDAEHNGPWLRFHPRREFLDTIDEMIPG